MNPISSNSIAPDVVIASGDISTEDMHPNFKRGNFAQKIADNAQCLDARNTPKLRETHFKATKETSTSSPWVYYGEGANVNLTVEKSVRVGLSFFLALATAMPKAYPFAKACSVLGTVRDGLFSFEIFNTAYQVRQKGLSVLNPLANVKHTLSSSTIAMENINVLTGNTIDALAPVYLGAVLLGSAAAAPIGTAMGIFWIANAVNNLVRTGSKLYYSQDILNEDGTVFFQFKDKNGQSLKHKYMMEMGGAALEFLVSAYCCGLFKNIPVQKIMQPASMLASGSYGLMQTFYSNVTQKEATAAA